MRTLLAIVPSAGVLFLFYLAIRGMLTADRRERAAVAEYEARMRAEAARREETEPGKE